MPGRPARPPPPRAFSTHWPSSRARVCTCGSRAISPEEMLVVFMMPSGRPSGSTRSETTSTSFTSGPSRHLDVLAPDLDLAAGDLELAVEFDQEPLDLLGADLAPLAPALPAGQVDAQLGG